MKIKISETTITFKISEDELNALSSGHNLATRLAAGGQVLSFHVSPHPFLSDHDIKKRLQVSSDETGMHVKLAVTSADVSGLSAIGKDRAGVSLKGDACDIFLQVDVRGDSRPHKG